MALFQNGVYDLSGSYSTSGSSAETMTVDTYSFYFSNLKATNNNLLDISTDVYNWKSSTSATSSIPGKIYVLTDNGWITDNPTYKISEASTDSVEIVNTSTTLSVNFVLMMLNLPENLAEKNIYSYLEDNQKIRIPKTAEGSVPMSKTATFSSEAAAYQVEYTVTFETVENYYGFVEDDAEIYSSLNAWVSSIQSAGGFSSDGKVYNIYNDEIGTWQTTTIYGINAIDIEITNTNVYSGVTGACSIGGGGCNTPLSSNDYLVLFSDGRAVNLRHTTASSKNNTSGTTQYFNKTAVEEIIKSFETTSGTWISENSTSTAVLLKTFSAN